MQEPKIAKFTHEEPTKNYTIKIKATQDESLLIDVNGELHTSELFEFVAPFGAGFKVSRLTRIKLE